MAAQVQIEHVEPRRGEVIAKTTGGQMPRVSVLAVTVNQQNGRTCIERLVRYGGTFAHHRKRDIVRAYAWAPTARNDNFFNEIRGDAAIDGLVDASGV